MDLMEFRRLAEAWGGDIARWPQAAQAPAWRLAASAEGAAALRAAQQLDALLADPLVIDPGRAQQAAAQVMQRLAVPRERPRSGLRPWLAAAMMARPRLPQLGFAASLALSVLVGASLAAAFPYRQTAPGDRAELLGLILDSGSLGSLWGSP
jgi:hypothetical protein